MPHKFVRTLSATSTTGSMENGPRAPVLGIHPGSTVIHRTGAGTGQGMMRSLSVDQHHPVISSSSPTFLSLTSRQLSDASSQQVLSRVHPMRQPQQTRPVRRQGPSSTPQSHFKSAGGGNPSSQQQYNTVLFSSSSQQQQQPSRPSQSEHNQKN